MVARRLKAIKQTIKAAFSMKAKGPFLTQKDDSLNVPFTVCRPNRYDSALNLAH